MQNKNCILIIDGCMPGVPLSIAAKGLAEKGNLTVENARKILESGPTAVKEGLSEAAAIKFRSTFEKVGCKCSIEGSIGVVSSSKHSRDSDAGNVKQRRQNTSKPSNDTHGSSPLQLRYNIHEASGISTGSAGRAQSNHVEKILDEVFPDSLFDGFDKLAEIIAAKTIARRFLEQGENPEFEIIPLFIMAASPTSISRMTHEFGDWFIASSPAAISGDNENFSVDLEYRVEKKRFLRSDKVIVSENSNYKSLIKGRLIKEFYPVGSRLPPADVIYGLLETNGDPFKEFDWRENRKSSWSKTVNEVFYHPFSIGCSLLFLSKVLIRIKELVDVEERIKRIKDYENQDKYWEEEWNSAQKTVDAEFDEKYERESAAAISAQSNLQSGAEIFGLGVLAGAVGSKMMTPEIHTWMCAYCSAVVQSKNQPSQLSCAGGKLKGMLYATHSWIKQ